MVDILDVALARALTPQGQIDTYAARAQQAVTNANTAIQNIENSATAIEDAIQTTQNLTENAQLALNNAQQAQIEVNEALVQISDAVDSLPVYVEDEIDKLAFIVTNITRNNAINTDVTVKYPSGKEKVYQNFIKYYIAPGSNTDGTMTQKAITDAIAEVASQSGGSVVPAEIDLGSENAGKIVIVDNDGKPAAGTITEEDIISLLVKSGEYVIDGTVGLQIDYENKATIRTQDAINMSMGEDFNKYIMYGGRLRCNVADNGAINAFYGDSEYKEDGSNGQVMVYQPKFYYQRTPIKVENAAYGQIIRKEILTISPIERPGFKLHPLFKDINGEELDYVLLPAYEGSVYDTSAHEYDLNEEIIIDFDNDKLSSIAGAKPVTGVKNELTVSTAEKLAKNRGSGWHITNMAMESATQMLEIVEFGTMNGQAALGNGISNIPASSAYNSSSLTGSTASLGNANGVATETINEVNGTYTTYSTNGRVAISYRGMENPWGNTWRFIGGCNIYGEGNNGSGIPYLCSDYNYNTEEITSNYKSIGFQLPNITGWVSAMGYGGKEYDWVYMPAECQNGNDATPVGDNLWGTRNLNGINIAATGGSWSFGTSNGPFYYGCDRGTNYRSNSYNPRLMFIPFKDAVYARNYNVWKEKMGV